MNYKKEYKKYLTSSILDTANNKIASSSLITAFAVYLGLSDLAIGIYAVLDTITNMLQIFAAPLFSKIGQSKIVVLSNYTIYRLASVGFAFIPFISGILAPVLYTLGEMSILDLIISIGLLGGTCGLLYKYGLRIYKAGILNYSSNKLWNKIFKSLKEK